MFFIMIIINEDLKKSEYTIKNMNYLRKHYLFKEDKACPVVILGILAYFSEI